MSINQYSRFVDIIPITREGGDEECCEPVDVGTCRVVLTHAPWERFGEDAKGMRCCFDNGWDAVSIESFGTFAGLL